MFLELGRLQLDRSAPPGLVLHQLRAVLLRGCCRWIGLSPLPARSTLQLLQAVRSGRQLRSSGRAGRASSAVAAPSLQPQRDASRFRWSV